MTEQMFEIKIEAIGEVRDKDGNLLSAEPMEHTEIVSESELHRRLAAANIQIEEEVSP